MTSKVDWTKPIEAVRKSDNKTFPVTFKQTTPIGDNTGYLTNEVPEKSNTNDTWYEDGRDWCANDAWYIRNTAPEPAPQWAIDEAKKRVSDEFFRIKGHHVSMNLDNIPVKLLAHHIAKYETPPIDPDLIEARKVASTRKSDFVTPEEYLSGKRDNYVDVVSALAGIKRGRELQAEQS